MLELKTVRAAGHAVALLTMAGVTVAATPAPGLWRGSVHVTAPASSANPARLTWHRFRLIDGWESASTKAFATGQPAWALRDGVVYFRGAIKQPGGGNVSFASLPVYARPARKLYLQVFTQVSASGGYLYIGNDGTLKAYNGKATVYTSLAGISYPTAAIRSRKLALRNGWKSSQPDFDTGDPSYTISRGVVYLSGSLHSTGVSALATILPKPASPGYQVNTLVYTLDGSTGELSILPTGAVLINGPQAPLYTSLAGISYPVAGTRWHNFKLQNGWKPVLPGYHTGHPGYAVIAGVVYLRGSMIQPAGSADVWTTLPRNVRTADALVLDVSTTGLNVGYLAMTTRVGVINSVPFSDAQAFTSLAPIAYPLSS